ncbi:hypothetical protein Droror1_Dr00028186 [Drosera rotundifolia]
MFVEGAVGVGLRGRSRLCIAAPRRRWLFGGSEVVWERDCEVGLLSQAHGNVLCAISWSCAGTGAGFPYVAELVRVCVRDFLVYWLKATGDLVELGSSETRSGCFELQLNLLWDRLYTRHLLGKKI